MVAPAPPQGTEGPAKPENITANNGPDKHVSNLDGSASTNSTEVKAAKISKPQKREKNNFFWWRNEPPTYDGYCYVLNLKEQAELKKLKEQEYSEDLKLAYLRNMFLKMNGHFRARYKVCSSPEQNHIRHLGLYKLWHERGYQPFEKLGVFLGGVNWAVLGMVPIGVTFAYLRKLKTDRENKVFRQRMRFGFLISLMGNFLGFQVFYYNLVIVPGFWKHTLAQSQLAAGLDKDLSPVLLEAFTKPADQKPTP